MIPLNSILALLEKIAPTAAAESWDNVGLIAGDVAQNINGVLLTIDFTAGVLEEAKRVGCNLIIAYHPPLFSAVKKLTGNHLVYRAIRDGIALYSPHTALDVAEGGTNDMLADAVGMTVRRSLRAAPAVDRNYKLVVFVPATAVDKVGQAIFNAGAGAIGNYSSCSFQSTGKGTFIGNESSNPTIGRRGNLESVEEIRLETLVPIDRVPAVIAALRQSHPYEEPAFDLLRIAAPTNSRGLGRVGELPAIDRADLFNRIKMELGLSHLLIAGPTNGAVSRVAVCAGACGDLLNDAIASRVDLYLTGEMRHHDAVKAAAAGVTVVCTLHSHSERAVLKRLKDRFESDLPSVAIHISKTDCDPFSIV